MPDVSVKEKIMAMEALHVSSRLNGKIEVTTRREVDGKRITLLIPKKAENLQSKTVKYYAGTAIPKQYRAHNPKFYFLLNCKIIR
jgi:hypothetical protein